MKKHTIKVLPVLLGIKNLVLASENFDTEETKELITLLDHLKSTDPNNISKNIKCILDFIRNLEEKKLHPNTAEIRSAIIKWYRSI